MMFAATTIITSDNNALITTITVALVAIVTAFLAVSRLMLKQSSKDREGDRLERKSFIEAIQKMSTGMENVASTNKEIAKATQRGADEAKERNGHLGELILQNGINTMDAIKNVKTQNVVQQNVKTSTVEKETVKK